VNTLIQIFTHFTTEILTVGILGLSVLIALALIFSILKKIKTGLFDQEVPAPPVKEMLENFLSYMHEMHSDLFGEYNGASQQGKRTSQYPSAAGTISTTPTSISNLNTAGITDAEKIVLLNQLQQQTNQVNELREKIRQLESSGENKINPEDLLKLENENKELKEHVQMADERLAEYSIIEDDLANLKRILQENNELRARIKTLTEAKKEPKADIQPPAEEASSEQSPEQEVISPTSATAPTTETTTSSSIDTTKQ
jgi:hypothetical protein